MEKNYFIRDIDKYIANIGIILSILYLILVWNILSRLFYLIIGILVLITLIIYRIIRPHKLKEHPLLQLQNQKSSRKTYFLSIIFFLLFLISSLLIYFRQDLHNRPLIYFVITPVMVGLIFLEIIYSRESQRYLILFQIITLGFSIVVFQSILYSSILGVDTWQHRWFVESILRSGSIPNETGYAELPIYHLLSASNSLITNLSFKYSTLYSISLSHIAVMVLFIFLIVKYIFKNYKVGLFSALFLINGNHFIQFSYWVIPNSLATIFVVIILYLFLKHNEGYKKIISLSILLMVILVWTHSITAIWMAVILSVAWFMYYLYDKINKYGVSFSMNSSISYIVPLFFIILMLMWWMFFSGHISTLVYRLEIASQSAGIEGDLMKRLMFSRPIEEKIISQLGMFLFFSIALIGLLYMVSKKGNKHTFVLSVCGFVTLGLSFFPILLGQNIIMGRWRYFAQIILSIPIGLSMFLLIKDTKKTIDIKNVLVLIFVTILVLLLLISPPANVENKRFFPNTFFRPALTESEMQSTETSSQYYNDSIYTDRMLAKMNEEEGYDVKVIGDFNDSIDANHTILVREEVNNCPYLKAKMNLYWEENLDDTMKENGYSKMYDNGQVRGYA